MFQLWVELKKCQHESCCYCAKDHPEKICDSKQQENLKHMNCMQFNKSRQANHVASDTKLYETYKYLLKTDNSYKPLYKVG